MRTTLRKFSTTLLSKQRFNPFNPFQVLASIPPLAQTILQTLQPQQQTSSIGSASANINTNAQRANSPDAPFYNSERYANFSMDALQQPTPPYGAIRPKVDFLENSTSYRYIIEMPGVKRENINLQYIPDKNQVLIMGDMSKYDTDMTSSRLIEREVGKYHRIISLMNDARGEEIHAKVHDGIVCMDVPKGTAKDHKVEIAIE